MSLPKLVVVGGSGKISKIFTKLVAKRYEVFSIIRKNEQVAEIEELGAKAVVLSISDASVAQLKEVIQGSRVLLWSAGAGGRQGAEGSRKVDYEGAVKVFDAIDELQDKPRVLVVSAIDVRNPEGAFPDFYTEEDKQRSKKGRESEGMANYYHNKYRADKDLSDRKKINFWTILKPSTLTDDEGQGRIGFGVTRLQPAVSRADVAAVLVELLDKGAETYGKAYNITGGDTPVKEAVDRAISEGVSSLSL